LLKTKGLLLNNKVKFVKHSFFMEDFNKNDKQKHFAQIKGEITELNDGEKFCSITLKVGHENPREVNMGIKKADFDIYRSAYSIGDKVVVTYYPTSHRKETKGGKKYWQTMVNVLNVEPMPIKIAA
jgi:hypothetical protein